VWTIGPPQLVSNSFLDSILLLNYTYSFVKNLERLFKAGYLPSDRDILYARSPTIGIVETKFKLEKHIYRMVDVGGQRSQRKKWIQAFDDVNAILFVAAINAYDQFLPEDPKRVCPSIMW
jgi:guanine nucleotide-binding protein subunit alpha, other